MRVSYRGTDEADVQVEGTFMAGDRAIDGLAAVVRLREEVAGATGLHDVVLLSPSRG